MEKLKQLYNILDAEINNNAKLLEQAERNDDYDAIIELDAICGTYQSVLDKIVKLMEE